MNKKHGLDILSPGLIDKIPLIVIGFGPNGEILYWNKLARQVTGYSRKEAVTKGAPLFFHMLLNRSKINISALDHNEQDFSQRSHSLRNKEYSILTREGKVRHIRWNSFLVREKESLGSIVVTGEDVTSQHDLKDDLKIKNSYIKTANNRLRKYISLDPHTGLLNYRHFMQRLNNNFYKALSCKQDISMLMVDIDHFCSINTLHGVSRGNHILKEMANVIRENIPSDFIAARFSGTQMAILMPRTDINTAFNISESLYSTISEHNFGFQDLNINIHLTVYMALGGYPHCGDVHTSQQLLDSVSGKLNAAKKMGTGSILVCSPDEENWREEVAKEWLWMGGEKYRYTMEFVNALANAVKSKDCYTREHSAIMSDYAAYIAEHLGLNSQDIRSVRFGSLLHDIGKIGIDKMILLKPTALTDAEYSVIKQHPVIGAEIIRSVHPLRDVVPFVLHHHERFDGTGYPKGLKGEEIPLGARIISLADVFQALTSDRPYRKALPEEEAVSIITDNSGKFFDPRIVNAFLQVYKNFK